MFPFFQIIYSHVYIVFINIHNVINYTIYVNPYYININYLNMSAS